MRNLVKGAKYAMVPAVSFALVLALSLLVALVRCPAAEIPEVIRAFGAWVHVSVRIG